MPLENSAGAIIFIRNKQIEYLLLYKKSNPPFRESWDFPRGNIEKNESELETVSREIREETGITYLRFIKGFRESISFFYRKEGQVVRKNIAYYLAETNDKEVKLSEEHDDYCWLPIEEALSVLTHKSAKDVLIKAHKLLTS